MNKFLPVWNAPDAAGGAAPSATPAPEPTPAVPDPVPSSEGPDLSFIPDTFKGEDGTYNLDEYRTHYQELTEAQESARTAAESLPKEASEYALDLPDDLDLSSFDLPEGYQIELNKDEEAFKPLFDELSTTLHEMKLPADAGGKFLGIMAKYKAMEFAAEQKAVAEQREKMGANADARMTALKDVMEPKFPAQQVEKVMQAANLSADMLDFLEAVLAPQNSSTPDPNPSNGADAGMAGLRRRYSS